MKSLYSLSRARQCLIKSNISNKKNTTKKMNVKNNMREKEEEIRNVKEERFLDTDLECQIEKKCPVTKMNGLLLSL